MLELIDLKQMELEAIDQVSNAKKMLFAAEAILRDIEHALRSLHGEKETERERRKRLREEVKDEVQTKKPKK